MLCLQSHITDIQLHKVYATALTFLGPASANFSSSIEQSKYLWLMADSSACMLLTKANHLYGKLNKNQNNISKSFLSIIDQLINYIHLRNIQQNSLLNKNH